MAGNLDVCRMMTRGKLIIAITILLLWVSGNGASANWSQTPGQPPPQVPTVTFKAGVDLVRVAAIVRDKKGRFVQDLTVRDFEVLDGGSTQRIADFRRDVTGVSVAVLFDVSGSMEGRLIDAREAAMHVLSWLDDRDEAAVFTFDTHLDERTPFTTALHTIPDTVGTVVPFGATSLHDAIAAAAKRVGAREGRRRAVVVFTDGADNASHMKAADVALVASEIDVPVYVFGVVPSIDNPTEETATISAVQSVFVGPLSDLATRTGGHTFVASTPAQRSIAARQIIDELRHQYLIAFESSGAPGWHPLVVRARNKDLVVRARSGYLAGQSRPSF